MIMRRIHDLRGRFSSTRLAVASLLVAVITVTAVVVAKRVTRTESPAARAFVVKKGDPDKEPGDNKRALVGPNDARWPDYTPEVEAYLLRAYPEPEVPGEATIAAWNGWQALNAGA